MREALAPGRLDRENEDICGNDVVGDIPGGLSGICLALPGLL